MNSERIRILLVEDNPGDARLIRETLAEAEVPRFEVTHVQRLADALKRLDGEGFDVALLDLLLPDSRGLDTLVNAQAQAPGLPILVLTGLDDEALAIKAVQEGAQDYLVKGQMVSTLLVRAVRYAIERKRAEEALRASEERLRYTLDNMLEGCQIIGYDWRYLYVNDAVAGHGRTTKEALLGKTMMEAYPGIDETEMFATLRRCMDERVSAQMENEFTFPDGGKGWFDLSVQPVPEGIFVLSVDITERKWAEEKERLRAQETEALFRVASALAQPGSFVERVTRVLEEVARAAEVDRVVLRLPDDKGQGLRLVAAIGAGVEAAPPPPFRPYGSGLTGLAFQQGEPVIANDLGSDPRALPDGIARGNRSIGALPIRSQGRLVGVITASSNEVGYFTPERVKLLAAIGDEIGALLENARLHQEISSALEESRHRLEAFRMAAGRLGIGENRDTALHHLVDAARELVGARYGALVMWDSQGQIGTFVASGLSPREQRRIGAPPRGMGLLGLVKDQGKSIRLGDISHLPSRHGLPEGLPPMKSFVGVPVMFKGQCSGTFCLTEKEAAPEFSSDDEQLLNLFAVLAGVLLENIALYTEVERERGTLAAIQSSITEGLVVLDPGGRVLYRNSVMEEITGLTGEDILGKPLEEALRIRAALFEFPEVATEALLGVVGASAQGPATVEVTLVQPRRRELSVTAFPIHAAQGERMTGLLVRDVTQERDLERRRDAFVSITSHELRTPMTTIMGFAQLLLDRNPPEPIRRQWQEHILGDSRRLAAIVDDLLNVSRIQSGKLSLKLERLPLQEVVEEALADVRPTTDRHEFVVEIAPGVPDVVADRDKLVQVLVNLVDNAAKYSPRGGRVVVSASHEWERERVVMGVADQGMGIAPEDQESLFTTFHRIHRPETEGIRGTGLGLYIVKELVELMGGEVWLESEVNQGSTFFFSLPTRQAA